MIESTIQATWKSYNECHDMLKKVSDSKHIIDSDILGWTIEYCEAIIVWLIFNADTEDLIFALKCKNTELEEWKLVKGGELNI
jgi:hypothetical protein